MAGINSRVHGYNPIYRNQHGAQNLHSFDLGQGNAGGPGAFIFRQVNINGAMPAALDHQGHIIPQNVTDGVLDVVMALMALPQIGNIQAVQAFIVAHNNQYPWLQPVFNYGTAMGIPMFDFAENEAEARVGGFFSIVTWNPINICRAPTDDRRGIPPFPGAGIDVPVQHYLTAQQAAQGVNQAWLQELTLLANALTPPVINPNAHIGHINDYITACSATLLGQQNAGIGYYSFPWVNNNNILSPPQA